MEKEQTDLVLFHVMGSIKNPSITMIGVAKRSHDNKSFVLDLPNLPDRESSLILCHDEIILRKLLRIGDVDD